eukprot:TRINITY_DN23962_c0_g1_i1.p1 TRINITY_DN23962_c0_g1~~TRINITY_DN23962_c0_g1_i1.p1  ORF type:complete len:891 (+),score=157.76 TRINITY_DN23962_c0_g1_i1:92-2764(+)
MGIPRRAAALAASAGLAAGQTSFIGPQKTTVLEEIYLEVDNGADLVTLRLQGPSDKWFAIGFGSQKMMDTHAVVITPPSVPSPGGTTTFTEYRLGDHHIGIRLQDQFKLTSATDTGGFTTVTLTRGRAGMTALHWGFWPADTLDYITATGNVGELPENAVPSAHSKRAFGRMSFVASPQDQVWAAPQYMDSPEYKGSPEAAWNATPAKVFAASPQGRWPPQDQMQATPLWDTAPAFKASPEGLFRDSPEGAHLATPLGAFDQTPLGQALYAPGSPRTFHAATPQGKWEASPVSTPRGQHLETPDGADSTPVGSFRRSPAQVYAFSPQGLVDTSPLRDAARSPYFRDAPAWPDTPRAEEQAAPLWDISPEGLHWARSPRFQATPAAKAFAATPSWDLTPAGRRWGSSPHVLASPGGTEWRRSPAYDVTPTADSYRQTPEFDSSPRAKYYRASPLYLVSPEWRRWEDSPEWDMTPMGWQRRIDARAFKGLAPLYLQQPSAQRWAAEQGPAHEVAGDDDDSSAVAGIVIGVLLGLCLLALLCLLILRALQRRPKAAPRELAPPPLAAAREPLLPPEPPPPRDAVVVEVRAPEASPRRAPVNAESDDDMVAECVRRGANAAPPRPADPGSPLELRAAPLPSFGPPPGACGCPATGGPPPAAFRPVPQRGGLTPPHSARAAGGPPRLGPGPPQPAPNVQFSAPSPGAGISYLPPPAPAQMQHPPPEAPPVGYRCRAVDTSPTQFPARAVPAAAAPPPPPHPVTPAGSTPPLPQLPPPVQPPPPAPPPGGAAAGGPPAAPAPAAAPSAPSGPSIPRRLWHSPAAPLSDPPPAPPPDVEAEMAQLRSLFNRVVGRERPAGWAPPPQQAPGDLSPRRPAAGGDARSAGLTHRRLLPIG